MNYNIQYKEDKSFSINIEDGEIFVNDQPLDVDIADLGNNKLHAILDNKSYDIQILKVDAINKEVTLVVDNEQFTFGVQDELYQLLDDMGMGRNTENALDDVKAPMPGLVLDVLVEVGDEITKGDTLLVLEAMKMENAIKAVGTGKVKAVKVSKQETVDKNQILIEVE